MKRIAEMMAELATAEGLRQTSLPGVKLYRASRRVPREPLCYQRGIIFVGQGGKRVYFGGEVYEYNPQNYLVLPLPIPAECETFAEADKPMLALMVDIDLRVLAETIERMGHHLPSDFFEQGSKGKGLYVSPMTREIEDALKRLLRALHSPLEASVVGSLVIRELLYRILLNDNGRYLLALAMKNSDLFRIDKALKKIHEEYDKQLDIRSLASLVNMSVSTFHRTFKEVTSTTPLQYIKKIRLDRAKILLVEDQARVGEAAAEVGYESSAQFSREFKRYFGRSPVEYTGGGQV